MLDILEMTYDDLEQIKDVLSTDFDDFWNVNILKTEIGNTNSKVFVVKKDFEIVGFASLWFGYEEIHITDIVVRKNLRKLRYCLFVNEKTY